MSQTRSLTDRPANPLSMFPTKKGRLAMNPIRALAIAIVALVAGGVLAVRPAPAAIVTSGLSVHYDAANADGNGNAGSGSTTTLVNLANPGTHDGTIVDGSGIVQNGAQIGTPYEYGIVLDGATNTASPAHIQTNSFQMGGGTNKVTAGTWEFWLRADNGGPPTSVERGALYGEFPAGTANQTRHYLRLEGIGESSRTVLYDEFAPSGNSAGSDSPLFDTGTFTQVVVTKNGDTVTFYENGVRVGNTKTNSETYSGPTVNRTFFGKREVSSGNFESFDGQFNIIRVYDKALTGSEVSQNYNATIPEPATLALLGLGGSLMLFGRRKV